MSRLNSDIIWEGIYGGTHLGVTGTRDDDVINIPANLHRIDQVIGYRIDGEHHVFGYQGDDTVTGDHNNINCLFGGIGDDTIYGGNKIDVLWGDNHHILGYYNDQSVGGNDKIHGGGGGDIIFGGVGDDTLYGDAGVDMIRGGAGDDLIVGGSDADRIYGGKGLDTASYAGDNGGYGVDITLAASGSTTTIAGGYGYASGDRLVSIENLIGTDHIDVLMGNSVNNILEGGGGGDILNGGGGDDDTASYRGSGVAVIISLAIAGDKLSAGIGSRVSFATEGSGADSKLTITFDTGAGDITAEFKKADSGSGIVIVDLYTDGDNNRPDSAGDTLISIENLIGSAFDDVLVGDEGGNALSGGAGDDHIYGGAGSDNLQGGAGADFLHGGEGVDWVEYDEAAEAVVVNLADAALNTGEALGDTYTDIENIIGSEHNDTLTGDDEDNRIEGGAGGDIIRGGFGDDNLRGGDGSDSLYGGVGNDDLYGGDGNDHLYGGIGRTEMNDLLGGEGEDSYHFDPYEGYNPVRNTNEYLGQDTIFDQRDADGAVQNERLYFHSTASVDYEVAHFRFSRTGIKGLMIEIFTDSNDLGSMVNQVEIMHYFDSHRDIIGEGFTIFTASAGGLVGDSYREVAIPDIAPA